MTICAEEGPTRESNTKEKSMTASSNVLCPAIPKGFDEVTMVWFPGNYGRWYFLPEDR